MRIRGPLRRDLFGDLIITDGFLVIDNDERERERERERARDAYGCMVLQLGGPELNYLATIVE